MIIGFDKWMLGFLIFSVILLGYQMIVGWQRGLVRQLFYLFSIGLGYLAGFYGGKFVVPLLRPFGYPDFLTTVVGGGLMALFTMLVMSILGALIFKKTSQQSVGIVRFFYGLSGGIMGIGVGLFFIWVALVGARLLGTVAESEIHNQPLVKGEKHEPTAVVQGLAEMKHSIDGSTLGSLSAKVDPIPVTVYSTLGKLVQMVSNSDATERFIKYPGSKSLAENPVIMALAKDPEIITSVRNGDYLGLMKNKHLVEVLNNQEVMDLFKKFNLEKALDYALTPDSKKPGPAKP